MLLLSLVFKTYVDYVRFLSLSGIQGSSFLAEAIILIGRLRLRYFFFDSHSLVLHLPPPLHCQCKSMTFRVLAELLSFPDAAKAN